MDVQPQLHDPRLVASSMTSQQTAHAQLFPNDHVTSSQLGYPTPNLVPMVQNMNLMYQTGTQLTNNSLPVLPLSLQANQPHILGHANSVTSPILYQNNGPSVASTATTQLPLSPLTTAAQLPLSPLTTTSNGHGAAFIPGLSEFNGNLSASHDSNIQYLLQQQQQQIQQYRNLQLQQQQLLQQQHLLQEQLSRLPQSPPVSAELTAPGVQSWSFPQHGVQHQVSAQQSPVCPPHASSLLPTSCVVLPQQAQLQNHNQTTQPDLSAPSEPQQTISTSLTTSQDTVDAPKVAAAPPHSYIPTPIDPRQNTLPSSLPTSLNPSLKVKPSFGIEAELSSQSPQSSWEGSKVEVFQDDHNTSGIGSSVASSLSPSGSSPTSPNFGRPVEYLMAAYERPPTKDSCLRCLQKVYAMEQIGPIKGVLYHKNCFVCAVCGTRLNLKNFHHNPNDMDDLSAYCSSHRPRERPAACDANAVLIKTALGVPKLDKVNEQIRSDQHSARLGLDRLDRKPSIVTATQPPQKEQYFYGMGLQQQQEYFNHQQQLVKEQQQQLLLQHQQTVNLLQQHQEQQQQQQQQQNSLSAAHSRRKSSLMSTGSLTGDSLVSTPTKCPDDVFHPQTYQTDQAKKSSSPLAASPTAPMSSASSSLSSATGQSLDKRQDAEGESLTNDLNDKLLLGEKGGGNKEEISGQEVQQSISTSSPHSGMRRSDRPSVLEDQSCDRVSISSCTSNTTGEKDSLDGASVTGPLPGQKLSSSSLERADRPSSRSSTSSTSSLYHPRQQFSRQCSGDSTGRGRDIKGSNRSPSSPLEKTVAAKVLVKSRSEMDFELQKKDREKRFLPRNESMRMDRPSQYS